MISILCASLILQSSPLVAGKTYDVPGGGRFDYMAVDSKYHRVFATHGTAQTLSVLDLKTGKESEIKCGQVNGVQVDEKLSRVFVTGGGQTLVALDRKTLAKLNEVALEGPGDDLAIDTKREQLYVCHDDGEDVWVFDASTLKKLATVKVAGAPEYIEYDAKTDKLYQNIKPTDQIQVIDPIKKAVSVSWPTGEEKGPHGLALDRKTGIGFSAGSNGKLIAFDIKSGKILSTVDIAAGTDQIAMDYGLGRVYCASRGFISVVQETSDGAKLLGNVVSPKGAHTIAVDPTTHDVWVCFGNAQGAYLQKFSVAK